MGAVAWSGSLSSQNIARYLTVDEGRLFASCDHFGVLTQKRSAIEVLDGRTGETLWRSEIPAHSYSAPTRDVGVWKTADRPGEPAGSAVIIPPVPVEGGAFDGD